MEASTSLSDQMSKLNMGGSPAGSSFDISKVPYDKITPEMVM
jgi:hypothetical protein